MRYNDSLNKNKLMKTNQKSNPAINAINPINDNISKIIKKLVNDNNRYKNINKGTDEKEIKTTKKKGKINKNKKISLSKYLLQKNSIVYKSNLSPLSIEKKSLNISNNSNFCSNYNKLMNKILDKNKSKEDNYERSNKLIKLKNIDTKGNELIDSMRMRYNDSLNKNMNTPNESFLPYSPLLFKKYKKYNIPVPEDPKINNTFNYTNKGMIINYMNSYRNKLNDNGCRPLYKNSSQTSSINHLNYTFDQIALQNHYHNIRKIKQNISLSNNDINKNFGRNKINKLENIKTGIKTDIINNENNEYIKIKDIFKKPNNSIKISNSHLVESTKNIQVMEKESNLVLDKTPDINYSYFEDKNKNKFYVISSNDKGNKGNNIDKNK
jgi:hypothetical protein